MTGLAAMPAMSAPRPSFAWVTPKPVRTLVVLTDIGVSTPPQALEAVLSVCLAKGLPVHLVVQPNAAGLPVLAPDHPVALFLRQTLLAFPGLTELVAYSPDLGRARGFQIARLAAQARSDLVRSIWPKGARDASLARLGTIACEFVEDPVSVAAVRSAGFRNVLAIADQPRRVIARMSGFGVLSLSGGVRTRLARASLLSRYSGGGEQQILALSTAEFADQSAADLAAGAARLAETLLGAEIEQKVALPLVRDLQMRIDVSFRRYLALHILHNHSTPEPGVLAFTEMLKAEGIGHSLGPPLASLETEDGPPDAYWVGVPDPLAGPAPKVDPGFTVVRAGTTKTWLAAQELPAGLTVTASRDPTAARGLDAGATLQLPLLAYFDGPLRTGASLLPAIDDVEDGAVVISPAAVETVAMRSALLKIVLQVQGSGATEFLPLDHYARRVLPDDGLLPAFLRTEALLHSPAYPRAATQSAEIAELQRDAQIAWQYFDKATTTSTGLCASTLRFDGQFTSDYTFSTMWDIGSHVNALMAASELGLIDDADFTKRATAIIKTLTQASRGSLKLPPEELNTVTGRGTRRFNSFDTGRLLLSLHRLRNFKVPISGIEDMVRSWDLARVVVDGRFHSIQGGKLVDDFRSHYTAYAVAGLRAWGIQAQTPIDAIAPDGSADAKMALLAEVANFGPIGAEPSLLHLLDAGDDFAARYLGNVLLAAQHAHWAATGVAFAPSETPIDRSPWFTYQGLSLNAQSDVWVVDADFANDRQRALDYRAGLRATSSKAAYLWRTVRNDAFAQDLLAKVRQNARTEHGFKSAVYLTPGYAMSDYYDINTSGIILQSIAQILAQNAPAPQ